MKCKTNRAITKVSLIQKVIVYQQNLVRTQPRLVPKSSSESFHACLLELPSSAFDPK